MHVKKYGLALFLGCLTNGAQSSSVNPEFFDLTKTYYKAISDAPNMNYSKAINDKAYIRDFTAKRDLYWENFVLPLKDQVLEQIISGDIFLDPICEKN